MMAEEGPEEAEVRQGMAGEARPLVQLSQCLGGCMDMPPCSYSFVPISSQSSRGQVLLWAVEQLSTASHPSLLGTGKV